MGYKYNFKTLLPLTYVDKKLGKIINFKCIGQIEVEKEDEKIKNEFLNNLQDMFNHVKDEYSYNEFLDSDYNALFINYYNSIFTNNKLISINISSLTPTTSSIEDSIEVKPLFCSMCGSKLNKNLKFCSECGAEI